MDVIDILKEEKVLTEEKAAYLLSLDAHTATCTRDQMLGRLAAANQMASESDIQAALGFQQARFRQTGESLRLDRPSDAKGRQRPGRNLSGFWAFFSEKSQALAGIK